MADKTLNEVRFAGDVDIKKVEIVNTSGFGQDITLQISSIQVFEGVFTPFITGTLIVDDALDLLNLFPMVGEEFLNLEIVTPSLDRVSDGTNRSIKGLFYIYKSSDRVYLGDKRLTYKLHFISIEGLTDINKKLSKSFQGRCSNIIENIVTSSYGLESKKRLNIEETSNSIRYVSNYWSPKVNLEYISERSINTKGNPSYFFFENRNGFNFLTLERLALLSPVVDFIYDNYTAQYSLQGRTQKEINEDYKRVEQLNIPVVYDYIDRIKGGTYASKLIGHDILTKKYTYKNYDSFSNYKKEEHLNLKSGISSKLTVRRSDAVIFSGPKSFLNNSGYTDSTGLDFLQKRASVVGQFNSHKIEIVVPGRTDYTVGQKVNFKCYKNVPNTEKEMSQDLIDELYSGNYLISAINHFISRTRHECHMELIKDSLIYELKGNT